MPKRERPPTDELLTDIYESKDLQPRRAKPATNKGVPRGPGAKDSAKDSDERPTKLDLPSSTATVPEAAAVPAPVAQHKSEPIRVISMKTPAEIAAERKATDAVAKARVHKAEIRALSDVIKRRDTPPGGIGYIAPPRDPKDVRSRRVREYVIYGSAVVIVSSIVMLAVWFLAR